jgi:hypothetical protein
MNVLGQSENLENSNVLSLFARPELSSETMLDPLQELLREAEIEAFAESEDDRPLQSRKRLLVSETQFPDQSLYTLEQQLSQLNVSLGRLKFYLSDLDDILPVKMN